MCHKNYFVKDACSSNLGTIYNFNERNCHIGNTYPLRKSFYIASSCKSFWILKERNVNSLGPRKDECQRLLKFILYESNRKKGRSVHFRHYLER